MKTASAKQDAQLAPELEEDIRDVRQWLAADDDTSNETKESFERIVTELRAMTDAVKRFNDTYVEVPSMSQEELQREFGVKVVGNG